MGDYALDDIHEGILYQYANISISRLFHTHALMSLTSYSECSFPCCSNSNWSYKDAVFVPSAVDLADSTLTLTRSIALLQSGSHPSWYVHSILISLRISVRSLNIVKLKNSAFLQRHAVPSIIDIHAPLRTCSTSRQPNCLSLVAASTATQAQSIDCKHVLESRETGKNSWN